MALIDRIKVKAKSNLKRIVLPEGDEARTIAAATSAYSRHGSFFAQTAHGSTGLSSVTDA